MSRVVDGEDEDVPVAAEPGDEEGTGEWLEGQLHHLSGTHPGGGNTQHHQQTTQHLQSRVGAHMEGLALHTGFTSWCLCVRLRAILSWWESRREEKNERKSTARSDFIWIILISIMSQSLILATFVFFAPLYIDFSAACIVASWLGSSTWASLISCP